VFAEGVSGNSRCVAEIGWTDRGQVAPTSAVRMCWRYAVFQRLIL